MEQAAGLALLVLAGVVALQLYRGTLRTWLRANF